MMLKRQQLEFRKKIKVISQVLIIGLLLTGLKFFAYFLTKSNAILTDALESIINIVAAGFGLYTLLYASKPKDENHPYGHGKMEFFAVGFEGALVFLTGCGMIYKAIAAFNAPHQINQLSIGIYITAFTGIINFFMGRTIVRIGKQLHSSTLIADGQHLIADTVSSVVLLIGLFFIIITGENKIDAILTIALGIYILFVGYKLLRNSMAGLMDETDFDTVLEIVNVLNAERQPRWIDIHNLRVVKYGSSLHVDLHMTQPWYENLQNSHHDIKILESAVNKHFENRVEFFIHSDPCRPSSCQICTIKDCAVRKHVFLQKLVWDLPLVMKNKPHQLN